MNRKFSVTLVVLLLLALLMVSAALAAEGVHWSYEGDTGPAYWGTLSPDYALCGTGQNQTPIDIPSSASSNPADLGLNYDPSAVNIFNNGHTIQVNYDPGSALKVDGDTYQLVQYHFHAASEHVVDGQAQPLELHLVHQNAQGSLAVVGVLLTAGAANPTFAPIFDNLPAAVSEPAAVPGASVDANDLLPADTAYWRYSGSLTTPPCSEGVKWFVMKSPVAVSAEQIGAYTAIYSHTARPVQPMGSRQFIVGQVPTTLPTTGADLTTDPRQSPDQSIQLLLILAGSVLIVSAAGGYFVLRKQDA